MPRSTFVYVTYIRTTPEKLWQALIDPEFTGSVLSQLVPEGGPRTD